MPNRTPFQIVFAVIVQVVLALCVCAWVSAQTGSTANATLGGKTAAGVEQGPDLNALISRIAAAQAVNHGQIKDYTVVRRYTLRSGTNENSDSQVVAEISYQPPAKKEYEIRETIGSGRGEKVVRRVLDHEVDNTDWHTTAVTTENYSFALIGREQTRDCNCYVLAITPRRAAKELVKGKAYVDPQTFQIRRIVGELAKSPSWWVKRVNLTLTFSDVRGMWLQTSAYADADVRLLGRHVLETHDIGYRTQDDVLASKGSPHSSNDVARTGARNSRAGVRGRTIPVIGTGVVMGPR